MKRFVLGIGIVGVTVVAIAGAGYLVVKNALEQAGQAARGGPAPYSYTQLAEMVDAANPPAADEVPKLIVCFDQRDESLRMIASEALVRIGPPAVEPLRARLKDKDATVRFYCVQTLGRLGPTAAPAAPDLVTCLRDSDADVRRKAAYALGQVGLSTDLVVEGLANSLSDSDGEVARAAVDSLEKIGAPVAPRLYPLLADAKGPTRGRLVDILSKVGSPPADVLPILVKLAHDPEDAVRQSSFKLLGQLGKPAVPTFKELLKKPNPVDVMPLPHAVALLGPDEAKEVLPELQVFLIESPWWDAEPELMGTIKKCGPDGAKVLVNVLKELQNAGSKHFGVNSGRTGVVLRTLGEMGPDAKAAVPALIELFKEKEAWRGQILDALGDIGPAARDQAALAVEAFLAKNEADPILSEKARSALARMGVFRKKSDAKSKDK